MTNLTLEENIINEVLTNNNYNVVTTVNSERYFLDEENRTLWHLILAEFNSGRKELSFSKIITNINMANDFKEEYKKSLIEKLNKIQSEIYIFTEKTSEQLIKNYIEHNIKNIGKKLYNVGENYTIFNAEQDIDYLKKVINDDKKVKEPTNYEIYKAEYLNNISQGKLIVDNGLICDHNSLKGIFGGYIYPKLYVIAGRPGMAKSALANNIFVSLSQHNQHGLYFSIENSKEELMKVLMAIESNLPIETLRRNSLTGTQQLRLMDKLRDSDKNDKWIYDEYFNVNEIRQHTEMMMKKYKIQFIIIDYFQIVPRPKKKGQTEEYENMSGAIMRMKKELNIAVFLLSQVNDRMEDKDETKPIKFQLGELKGTGSLEQDADEVIGLEGVRKDNFRDCKIAKSRTRQLNTINVEFDLSRGILLDKYPSAKINMSENNNTEDGVPI